MCTLINKLNLFIQCQKEKLKEKFLRLGCHFISSWYYFDNGSICTIGKVLKLDKIYCYVDEDTIEIVRLYDVHIERGYLYCSLFFFSKNKIITVRQTLLKGKYVAWWLKENREFDEIMSRKLWQDVSKHEELLEFDFSK
jgi:hypothetical protein